MGLARQGVVRLIHRQKVQDEDSLSVKEEEVVVVVVVLPPTYHVHPPL